MKKVLALSAVMLALTGCQMTQQAAVEVKPQPAECFYYGKSDMAAPNWICSPNANRDEFIREAVGFSGNTAGGIAHQKNLAILQAKKELADQVKTEIISKVKSKAGTLGVDGSAGGTSATSAEMAAIANVQLEGVEIIRSFRGPDGYFYVHVALPRDVFKQNIANVIAAVEEKSPETVSSVTPATNKQLSDDIAKALGEM